MKPKRTHVVIPEELIKEIDLFVGRRKRSQFITQAAEERLKRVKQARAIERATGSWKDADHPEMAGEEGTSKWVRSLREESEHRLKGPSDE